MSSAPSAPIRLTQLARGGGCAAKLRLPDLVRVLDDLQAGDARAGLAAGEVLVATEFSDDAAVARVRPGRAIVMTADVIAPLVDDPEDFGRIAATNAISDVYAMGGEPRWALNLAFIPDDLPHALTAGIMAGAARACRDAGVAVVGGHTVRDLEPKFGLSVTGDVAEDAVWSNRKARAGQALVLSKALGTGILSQAIKMAIATADELAAAIGSMTTLNRGAMEIGRRFAVSAATDVTGFGLFGHLRNILRGSSLTASLDLAALPALPGARRYLADGLYPGGSRTNLEFVTPSLRGHEAVDPHLLQLAADAQTSGGLLLCVDAGDAGALSAALRDAGLPAATIGRLVAPSSDLPVGTIALG